jgi:integral membrane sensor domain MASE1
MAGASGSLRFGRAVLAAAVVAGYAASVLFSILVARSGGQGASVWTANGFLAGGLILLPRVWRAPVATICVVSQIGISLAAGDGALRATLYPLVNLIEAGLAAWLAVRFCGAHARRLSLRELVLLPLGAIIPAAIVGGLVGAAVNAALNGQGLLAGWVAWAAPGGFGMLIVLPVLLLATRLRRYKEFRRSPLEVMAITLGFGGLTASIFLQSGMPLQFLIYPALTFVAFRLGPPGAAIAGCLVALVCLPLVMLSHGPASFAPALDLTDRVRLAELAVSTLLFTTLATAGAFADQLRLRRLMIWRDQAARAARRRARRAERLAGEALEAATAQVPRDAAASAA